MQASKENVFHDIANCPLCDDHMPFHFEMGHQKIMIISLLPLFATLHRPLYFVQLFRKMCLALFGDVPPSERFIKEFYDPAGSIYWTHYQKCFKNGATDELSKCEYLLKKEVNALNPEIIIILGNETVKRLSRQKEQWSSLQFLSDRHPYISKKTDGNLRQVFIVDFPSQSNADDFEEIRKAIKPHINWISVECQNPDFTGTNFLDMEYACIEYMHEPEKTVGTGISSFENEWVKGIILPNVNSYNLILQIFTFIESNIKNLLESRPELHGDFEKVWITPFEDLINKKLSGSSHEIQTKRRAVHSVMADIDSLHTLRNAISHKGGVIDDPNTERKLKNIAKLKRLKGIYIYGGNSIFISKEGIDNILNICDNFRRLYTESFI